MSSSWVRVPSDYFHVANTVVVRDTIWLVGLEMFYYFLLSVTIPQKQLTMPGDAHTGLHRQVSLRAWGTQRIFE